MFFINSNQVHRPVAVENIMLIIFFILTEHIQYVVIIINFGIKASSFQIVRLVLII